MVNAITISGVSKRYQLGAQQQRATTFREAAVNTLTSPFRRFKNLRSDNAGAASHGVDNSFWALKDVGFDVKAGEVIGLIGRNGAGKSTLLKILSRITEPTSGEIRMRGRVASLLEVGTGFHPELTGRENIYLNGAILGMKKVEIDGNFDAIVAFAEVEKFLDTPVKFYSSGMYVRLAFAVAAHLEPEILIVDEVLAVGDAAFQKKCLGRMGSVAREGRTILFVSHNMAAVKALCSRAVWLKSGQVHLDGKANAVVDTYLRALTSAAESRMDVRERPRDRDVGARLRITSVVLNKHQPICHGQPVHLRMEYETVAECEEVSLGIGFASLDGVRICTLDTDLMDPARPTIPAGTKGAVEIEVEYFDLQPGVYLLDIGARSGDAFCLDYIGGCGQVEVIPGPDTPTNIMRADGGVRMRGRWAWSVNAAAPEAVGV